MHSSQICDASNLSQLRGEKRRRLEYVKRQQSDVERALDDSQGQSVAESMRRCFFQFCDVCGSRFIAIFVVGNFIRQNSKEVRDLDDKYASIHVRIINTFYIHIFHVRLKMIEKSAVKTMREYFQSLVPSPTENLQFLEQYYKQKFQKQVLELDEKRKKETENIMQHIDDVKKRTLTEEDARKMISDSLRKTKEELLSEHTRRMQYANERFETDIQGLKQKVDEMSNAAFLAGVTKTAAEIVITEIKKHVSLENLTEQERKLAESEDGRPATFVGQLVQLMRKEVKKCLKEDAQQQQLLNIPQYKELTARLTKVELMLKDAATQHSLELHHQTVRTIMQQLKEQQSKIELTQKHIRESEARLHRNSSLATLTDMVKRVDNMNREISLLKNRMDMSTLSLDVKYKEIERTIKEMQSDADEGIDRKRPRVESDADKGGAFSAPVNNNIKELEKQIQSLEIKHQHLVEFVHQFRQTVLNPQFPGRLEEVVKQIEETLQSHDSFLTFLVDPVTALKEQEITVPLEVNKDKSEGELSPAMVQAIQKLVQRTAEETARPLLIRIAALEKAQSDRPT